MPVRRAMGVALMTSFLSVTPAVSDGFSGAYLAARQAFADNDFSTAAGYFTRALVQDPNNTDLMENALLAFIGNGDIQRALAVARRMQGQGHSYQIANMVLLADAANSEKYDVGAELLAAGEAVGPLVDGLAKAWVQVGQGNMTNALATFDDVATEDGLQSFGLYHKAMALALVGDYGGANEILSGETGPTIPQTLRGIVARVEILSQLERNSDALALIEDVFNGDLSPTLASVRDRLAAGETLPFTAVRGAKDGLSEVFYSVAGALTGEANDGYTLLYTRMADFLRPDHVDSLLLTAQLLEQLGRYELATAAYDRIPRDDPAFHVAELGRAEALEQSGNSDAAIEVLEQLSESHGHLAEVHVTLGDSYRRLQRYGDATQAYDNAVEIYGDPEPGHWVLYYTRGISLERLDRWDMAEADLRLALKLQPDQPQVLNYLGYSFVEQQINLDEALDMIERAVAARPNDGYITDSLGWVLYRLDRYEEAVGHMERAAELMAVDPIINDHLGDVYWAVGRKREAEFQWNRALSFEPDEEDAARIRKKLSIGLDLVLEEEGA
ncbi:MAG: tetratricopeptide repeat protein, partial [Paracoccaceae bacterium]